MTPKDKAEELINKFVEHTKVYHEVLGWEDYIDSAKKCALIAVDEILNSNPSYDDYGGNGWIIIDNSEYWKEVKNEIENL